jgi:hypothetical protein
MTQRFEKAYNALYNAFMNDSLAKGSCSACAVGNIVAAAQGDKVFQTKTNQFGFRHFECSGNNSWWSYLFVTSDGAQERFKYGDNYGLFPLEDYEIKLTELTGYTVDQMAEIEFVFETSTKIPYTEYDYHNQQEIMEDQFAGLMAVMDVLIKFDEITNGDIYKNNFKNKFATA